MDRNVEVDPIPFDRPTTEDVVDLLDDLRREGFSLGVEQYVLAENLRSVWSAGAPSSPDDLALRLSPVLCKSAHEQSLFADRFAEHAALWRRPGPEAKRSPRAFAQRPARPARLAGWSWALLGALLLVTLSIVLARLEPVFLPELPLAEPTPVEQPPLATSAAPVADVEAPPHQPSAVPEESAPVARLAGTVLDEDAQGIAGAVVALGDGSQARTDSGGSFALETRTLRDLELAISHPDHEACEASLIGEPPARIEIRLGRSLRRFADEVRAALVLAPLVAFLCWLGWSRTRRRLVIERLPTREEIDLSTIPLPTPREILFTGPRAKRAQVELAIHRTIESPDLDEAATVDAMASGLGIFRPIYRARRVLPAYLVLADRIGLSDQQARLVDEVLAAIATPEVSLTRFWFSGDPRLCVSADRRRERVDLRELHARHGGQRLLLFTDGAGLLDPALGAAPPWLHLLESWEERAIFTPVPAAQWGERELLLARAGFPIYPLSLDGLRTFAASLRDLSEATAPSAPWSPPYPSLVETRPKRWLERNPVSAEEREELLRQLRIYLEEDGFRWLCACAVYPALSWYLTLFLGLRLERPGGGRVLSEETLLRLVRLPWFRHGSMPDWLRVTLVAHLSPEDEETVRDALTGLLLRELHDPSSPFTLEFGSRERDRTSARRSRRRQLRDLLRHRSATGPLRDYVFVTFLLGRRPDRLQLVAPNALQRMVYHRGVRSLGIRPGAALALALAGATLGWVAGARIPWPEGLVPCNLLVSEPARPAPTSAALPSPEPAREASPATTPVAIPPPEASVEPSATPLTSPEPSPSATPTPEPTSAPSASPAPTSEPSPQPTSTAASLAALGKTRFSPPSLTQLGYGRSQDLTVEVPAQIPADQLAIAWTVDGREVARGQQFRFAADRPELVRKKPVEIEVQVKPRMGEPITHAWSVAVRPPAPRIVRTDPPAGTAVRGSGKPARFEVVADAPVGAQQLSYVFLVDGKEAARTSKPSFDVDPTSTEAVAAYVVDDFGQQSGRVTWKVEATADLKAQVQSWLERFEGAWNAKSATLIGQMLRLDPGRIAALKSALDDKTDLKVRFDNVSITEQSPSEATATYQRTETFVDTRSGRRMTLGPQAASHRFRLEDGKLEAVGP